MNAETVNKILGITEAYKMPEALMSKLMNGPTELFNKFMEVGEPLDHDWFTEYFQTEHGDRDKLKQDYTPDSVCEIATSVSGVAGVVGDICSGTGGLTLKAWQHGAKEFYCIEYSSRAIPVLLTNLAIRNIKATVIHGDALTKETFNAYKLTPSDRYSTIEVIEDTENIQDFKCDSIIMNPPYSMKWDGERMFFGYETPPKSKCDYAFVLDGLEKLKDGGSLVAILPHGVLFRSSKEGEIRKQLLLDNMFDSVVGLPENLFLNTAIPVCILKWKKNKRADDVLFVDASKKFEKRGKLNVMTDDHITSTVNLFRLREDVSKLTHVANLKEFESNSFNLNIPRYVDTYEPPEPINIIETMKELYEIEQETKQAAQNISNQLHQLTSSDCQIDKDAKAVAEWWDKIYGLK